MRRKNGVLILVLGILSLVGFGPLTGLPAWILGNIALRDIDAGRMAPGERSIVQVGRIIGMIVTILFLTGLVLALILQFMLFSGPSPLFKPSDFAIPLPSVPSKH